MIKIKKIKLPNDKVVEIEIINPFGVNYEKN
jgi:hypothetical protein